jgi:hypothetical protein
MASVPKCLEGRACERGEVLLHHVQRTGEPEPVGDATRGGTCRAARLEEDGHGRGGSGAGHRPPTSEGHGQGRL